MFEAGKMMYSTYRYGCEIKSHEFYKVLKVNNGWVTLQKHKKQTWYQPEADGCIYFNTYHESVPTDIEVGKPFRRKLRKAYGDALVCNGDSQWEKVYSYNEYTAPLEEYNLH